MLSSQEQNWDVSLRVKTSHSFAGYSQPVKEWVYFQLPIPKFASKHLVVAGGLESCFVVNNLFGLIRRFGPPDGDHIESRTDAE